MSGGASRSKHLLLALLTVHLLLAAVVCTHEMASLVGDGLTILPRRYNNCALGAENFTGTVLGLNLSKSNPIRQGLATYLNLTRTGEGYGYFAPNVPDAYRLVFKLEFPDGHTEERVASSAGGSGGLRIASLLDQIGSTSSPEFRDRMIKKLAEVLWHESPKVARIHASLSQLLQPTIGDYAQGKQATYDLLYAYDFSLTLKEAPNQKQ